MRVALFIPALLIGSAGISEIQSPDSSHSDLAVEIFRHASPAVLSAEVLDPRTNAPMWGGTAFLVNSSGILVTNYHVVNGATRMEIRWPDGKSLRSLSVLALDPQNDLALLKIPVSGAEYVPLACNARPEVGTKVFTIGNSLGPLENTFSEGLISGIRNLDGHTVIQISAPISHGNSGGPLLNSLGEVIGVTAATLKGGQSLNFAIPVSYVCQLMAGKHTPMDLETAFGTKDLRPSPASNPGSLAGTQTVDKRWFKSDKKAVLADPHFYEITVREREQVLSEIDPVFRNMSSEKRHSYLWRAERDSLPVVSPVASYTWTAADPNRYESKGSDGEFYKVFDAAKARIEARVQSWGFEETRIRIQNKSPDSIAIVPETFSLDVIKPKPIRLRFEYPTRVSYEMFSDLIGSPLLATLQAETRSRLLENAASLSDRALGNSLLGPGESVEGNVYFEWANKRIRDVRLNVLIGREEYRIPFAFPK